MKIAPTIFPMKSIDRKELHQYYDNFDVYAPTNEDGMSDSLKNIVSQNVFATTHRVADDPSSFNPLFRKFGTDWQWNSGTHVQTYNVGDFAKEHGIPLSDPEALSYTNLKDARIYKFKLEGGGTYEVRQRPPLEKPMDSETFKNTVGKALITLHNNYQNLDNIRGYTKNRPCCTINIEYDPKTKSINTDHFIKPNLDWTKSALTSGDIRGEGLNLGSEYLNSYLDQLNVDLLDFMKKIL